MSDFAVKLTRIGMISPHDNADRLELATLTTSTYQFVVPKDAYHSGDLVVYFPLDSLLPPAVIQVLGLEGKLAGPEHNRVKTVKLRGAISQGVVARLQDLIPAGVDRDWQPGDDLTDLLGVVKYEPPALVDSNANLRPLPPTVSVYDIENAENYLPQTALLMDQPVVITEKLEGSHWGLVRQRDGQIMVVQRRHRVEPIPDSEHTWHKVARLSGLIDKIADVQAYVERALNRSFETFTLRGELIGPSVQNNIYQLKQHEVRLFEIEADGVAIDAELFLEVCRVFDLPIVPILWPTANPYGTLREWLDGKDLRTASNGQSALLDKPLLREGVVIKPLIEQPDPELGRLMLKQRSPEYLAHEK